MEFIQQYFITHVHAHIIKHTCAHSYLLLKKLKRCIIVMYELKNFVILVFKKGYSIK